jgi:uncharacterized protein (TIGR01319 family)
MTDLGSILVADCGSTRTTVALIERVNGHHRLVARGEAISTHGSPWLDTTVGVRQAVRQIERLAGRKLLAEAEILFKQTSRTVDGVDTFLVVSSAGAPLQVVVAGLTHGLSLASAQRAVAGTYALTTGVLALDEGSASRDPNARMKALRQTKPDVIFITGGTDGGAVRPVMNLAQLVALYNQILDREERPLAFYAGNAHLADDVAALFATAGELRVVANVHPSPDLENLRPAQIELETVYRTRSLTRVPGYKTLSKWASRPIIPTTRSFGQLIRYIGDRYQLKAVGMDLGSASTSLAARAGDLFSLTTRADLGIGLSVGRALEQIPPERITRWLPFEMASADARDVLLNKSLHPASVPQTREDLLLEYALAREVMRLAVAQARPGWLGGGHHPLADTPQWDLMIGAGRTLSQAPHPGHAALLLVDALEPVGVSQIAIDATGIAATLGAVAVAQPLAAVEVVEHDAFLNLGTVVAPLGTARPGEVALRVKVCYTDGQEVQQEVSYGSISVIPLAPGERVMLELHPTRRFDMGLGEPGLGVTAEAEGGILGLVIDARGRPLELPSDEASCRNLVQEWLTSIGIEEKSTTEASHINDWLGESVPLATLAH